MTVTLPTAAGFGSHGFYGHGFGYFSTGAEVSVPLAFIPSSYGSWKTNTGLITVAEVGTAHIGKIALSISNRDSGVTKIDLFYLQPHTKAFFLAGAGRGHYNGVHEAWPKSVRQHLSHDCAGYGHVGLRSGGVDQRDRDRAKRRRKR